MEFLLTKIKRSRARNDPGSVQRAVSTGKIMDFIKDLHESRMTKDNGSSQRLTYTDCGERMYLILLALETMRQFSQFRLPVQRYCKKTAGFESYKYYRIMGTDLYNFVYFLVGNDSAQRKLKDPDSAIELKRKQDCLWPLSTDTSTV